MEQTVKVKVLQDFRDREHGLTLRKAGSVIEVSPARAGRLTDRGLAERIREETPKQEPEKAAKPAALKPKKKK